MSADKKEVAGPVKSVPCPHCKKSNDLSSFQAQGVLQPKERYDCDHCSKPVEIVGAVLIVRVRAWAKANIQITRHGDKIVVAANGRPSKPLPPAALDCGVVTALAQGLEVDYRQLRDALVAFGHRQLHPSLAAEQAREQRWIIWASNYGPFYFDGDEPAAEKMRIEKAPTGRKWRLGPDGRPLPDHHGTLPTPEQIP